MRGDPHSFDLNSYAACHYLAALYAAALVVWVFLRGDRASGRARFALVGLPLAGALAASGLMLDAFSVAAAATWARRAVALTTIGMAAWPSLAAGVALGPLAHRGALSALYAAAAGLALATLGGARMIAGARFAGFGSVLVPGLGALALLPLLAVTTIWPVALLSRVASRARPGPNRTRIVYLALGGLALSLFALELPGLSSAFAFLIAPLAACAGLSVLAYALVEGAPRAASQAVLGTIAWITTSALAFVPVYALVLLLHRFAAWSRPAAAAALLVALFALLALYFRAVQPRIDRLFRRAGHPVRRELSAFAARALDLRTQAELARDLDALLGRIARVRLKALYLRAGGQWPGVGPDGTPKPPIDPPPDPQGPVARYLARLRVPIARESGAPVAQAQPGPAGAQKLLGSLGADALAPIAHKDELCGLCAIVADGGLGRAELDTLARVRAEMGVAALNAALYERARRIGASLEEKVAARGRELERAARDLADAERRLVQQEKMSALGLLATGVGHQIGEALNLIAGNLPSLRRYLEVSEDLIGQHRAGLASAPCAAELGELERKHRLSLLRTDAPALVHAIEEGTRRARAIATDLRRFAMPDDAAPEPIDVAAGLEAALHLLQGEWKGRIRVHKHYAQAVPRVQARRGQLDQVWMNLLLNAIQAMPAEGELELSIERVGTDEVAVTVRDSGPGVPAELRERVFEPFFTTKPVGQGTGLGLAISYGIARRHGGRIELLPAQAGLRGAAFRVFLPAAGQAVA